WVEGIGGRRSRPTVWHMHEVRQSSQRFKQFAGQVVQRADTGMPIGQLAGIGLGVLDELTQRVSRHCGMDRKGKSRNHHVCNRLELFERIVEWAAVENSLGDVSARTTQQDSVAVRAGASDRGSAERTASSPLVFNEPATSRKTAIEQWVKLLGVTC